MSETEEWQVRVMEEKILYGEQTRKTRENMSFSGKQLSGYPEYIRAMAQVKWACARANERAGQLSQEKTERIGRACQEIIDGGHLEQFPVDVFHGGGGIGLNMNMNEVLAALAGGEVQPVDDINFCQSTSDVCHTSLRIALSSMTADLTKELDQMIECLRKKSREFEGIDTIARTCWQDGMKVRLSALLDAQTSALERKKEALLKCRDRMREINLGWTVIGSGTGSTDSYREVILEELDEVTGRDCIWRPDPYDAAQYPDDLTELSGQVRMCAAILSKFSRDLRLLSSGPETGLMELKLPALQAGSSFFPGKVNPVLPEMMIQCNMLITGNDTVIQSCLEGGETYINLWEELMGFLLMDSISMLRHSIRLLREKCIAGMEADREICRKYAHCAGALITEYKETYGYGKLSSWIKKEGTAEVIRKLKEQNDQ